MGTNFVMYVLHIYLIISKLYKVDTIIPNSAETDWEPWWNLQGNVTIIRWNRNSNPSVWNGNHHSSLLLRLLLAIRALGRMKQSETLSLNHLTIRLPSHPRAKLKLKGETRSQKTCLSQKQKFRCRILCMGKELRERHREGKPKQTPCLSI